MSAENDELVEGVARAIAGSLIESPSIWPIYEDEARAAIAAVRKYDAERGKVSVPRAPIASALSTLPGGFWETWTSNSYRRITAANRTGGPCGDGGVLCGEIQRSDGHPDLSWTEEECEAACVLVNTLRAMIAAQEDTQ